MLGGCTFRQLVASVGVNVVNDEMESFSGFIACGAGSYGASIAIVGASVAGDKKPHSSMHSLYECRHTEHQNNNSPDDHLGNGAPEPADGCTAPRLDTGQQGTSGPQVTD